ncbi:MAG: hypothetical protein AB1611_00920 [bacterium]
MKNNLFILFSSLAGCSCIEGFPKNPLSVQRKDSDIFRNGSTSIASVSVTAQVQRDKGTKGEKKI